MVVILALGCMADAAAGRDVPLEPADQATVDAYLAWAAFLKQRGDDAAASAMDDRATELRKAADYCSSSQVSTSTMVNFDPYRELQGFARALTVTGDVDAARRIQDVAQSYREEQVLRTHMQGGQVLDPARYIGRPVDYEQLLPITPKAARYGLHGPGFDANQPPGPDWSMTSAAPCVFEKLSSGLAERRAQGYLFDAVITTLDPGFAARVAAEEFPRVLEERLRALFSQVLGLRSVAARQRGPESAYCASFDLSAEDRKNQRFPGAVLEIVMRGFGCLEVSGRVVVLAYYSERWPQGSATIVTAEQRDEAEAFLRSIAVTPLRSEPSGVPKAQERSDGLDVIPAHYE